MRLISFNIWGAFGPEPEKRWRLAAREIAKLAPDWVCLQEATDPDWLKDLARASDLKVIESDCAQTGLAILGKTPVDASGLVPYPFQSPVESYFRKIQWAVIPGSKPWFLANTHLSWKPTDEATRARQAEFMQKFAESKHLPALLCGDFNCEYSTPALASLRAAGYCDSMSGCELPSWDNANPWIRTHTVVFPDRRIDLVLLGKNFPLELVSADLALNKPDSDGRYPSDHYAVSCRFKS